MKWRVEAHHRVAKYDDVSSSEESGAESEARSTRRKKREKTTGAKSKFSLTKKSRGKK